MLFYFLAFSLISGFYSETASNIQEKSYRFFEIEFQTYRILSNQFDTVVLWVYDNDSAEEKLQKIIEQFYKKKAPETEVIFCKGKFESFSAENPDVFNQVGFYFHHEDQIVFLELAEINEDEFVTQMINTIQPELEVFTEKSDAEEYLKELEQVKGLLILDEADENFANIQKIFQKINRSGALKISGLNVFFNLFSMARKELNDYRSPALVIKNQHRYPIQFEGSLDDQNQIIEFIKTYTLPLIVELVPSNLDRIFNGLVKTSFLLLISEDPDENEMLISQYKQAAFQNAANNTQKGKIVFGYCSFQCNSELWKEFQFTEHTLTPQLILTEVTANSYYLDKYFFTYEKINQLTIHQFIDDFREKKLDKFFLSEPIPEPDQWIEIWKKIVSKNFEKEIFKSRYQR